MPSCPFKTLSIFDANSTLPSTVRTEEHTETLCTLVLKDISPYCLIGHSPEHPFLTLAIW